MPSDSSNILVVVPAFLPGYRFGGPVRSIANLISKFSTEFTFSVVTANRDLGETKPYAGVVADTWIREFGARIFYSSNSIRTLIEIRRELKSNPEQVLYLNGVFNFRFTILPLVLRRFGLIKSSRVVVSPRGALDVERLKLKGRKKSIFVNVARKLKLYEAVVWHATDDVEKTDIRRCFGREQIVHVAHNVSLIEDQNSSVKKKSTKQPGYLKLIFVSRISPEKNLLALIEALRAVRGNVELSIVGPSSNADYFRICQNDACSLPPQITAHWQGALPHDDVLAALAASHVFALPSIGENFGHAIAEALGVGLPVLISDSTPWGHVAARLAGLVVAAKDVAALSEAIQTFIDMNETDYRVWSQNAVDVYQEFLARSDDSVGYEALFGARRAAPDD